MGIGLTAEGQRVEIGDGRGGEHPLELSTELVGSDGHDGEEALLLPHGQAIHRYLGAGKLHGDVGLDFFQTFLRFRLQFQIDRTVKQDFFLGDHLGDQLLQTDILDFTRDGGGDVAVAALELVAPQGILDGLPLLCGFYRAQVNPHGHAAVVSQLCEDGLLFGGVRVLPDSPDASAAVADAVPFRQEGYGCWGDTVKEVLGANGFLLFLGQRFSFEKGEHDNLLVFSES